MTDDNSGVALVTGASSGLGTEIARLLAAHGYDVVVAGRDTGALAKLAEEIKAARPVAITTVVKDLAQPGAAKALVTDIATYPSQQRWHGRGGSAGGNGCRCHGTDDRRQRWRTDATDPAAAAGDDGAAAALQARSTPARTGQGRPLGFAISARYGSTLE